MIEEQNHSEFADSHDIGILTCVIYYNACILSQVLDYAERTKDFELADRIKPISPVSWKHVNFYGEYTFRDPGEVVDLDQMISRLVTLEWDGADVKQTS